MFTTVCPYCGTTSFEQRSNCKNCGAALPPPVRAAVPVNAEPASTFIRSAPPMPPRPVPRGYLLKRMFADARVVIGLVFSITGVIFVPISLAMAFNMDEKIGAWIFGLIGFVDLLLGPALLLARLAAARRQLAVLRDGQAALGTIETLHCDTSMEINGRSPWVLAYSFNVLGRPYQGKVSTLRDPDPDLRPAAQVYVLYDPSQPEANTLYLDL